MMLPDVFEQLDPRRKESYADAVMSASEEHNVPVSLIASVLRREGSRPGEVSPKGAMGPMQIMPSTALGLGVEPGRLLNDAGLNISLGTKYLNELMGRFGGNERQTLAAYNAGPTRVSSLLRKHGSRWDQFLPQETQRYLTK